MRYRILAYVFIIILHMLPSARAGVTCKVTVSVPPQKFLVERIGKSEVTVNSVLGLGENPHRHSTNPDDVQKASDSVMYFTLGFPFERSLVGTLVSCCDGLWVVPAFEGQRHLNRGEIGEKKRARRREQHVWMCPDNVRAMIEIIARRLSEEMPEKKQSFRRNAEILDFDVDFLDREIKKRLDSLPEEQRILLDITPYWHYFTTHYGLRAYQVPSADEDDLASSVRLCREKGIRTVLAPAAYPPEQARALARAINGKVILIDPLENNWFDTMYRASSALLAPLN